MKDAKITSTIESTEDNSIKLDHEPEFNLNSRFPTIVTTDDLVVALGKAQMVAVNYEKLLTGVYRRLNGAEQALRETIPKMKDANQRVVDAEKAAVGVKASQELYEQNNRKLSDALADLRKENQGMKDNALKWQGQVKEATDKAINLGDDLVEAIKAHEKAEKKADRLKKQLANLKKKVKNGKHSSN